MTGYTARNTEGSSNQCLGYRRNKAKGHLAVDQENRDRSVDPNLLGPTVLEQQTFFLGAIQGTLEYALSRPNDNTISEYFLYCFTP